MALIDVGTEDELKKLMEEHRGCLFTLHFWASWAKQCEQMNDVLGELAKDSKLVHVKFIKVGKMLIWMVRRLGQLAI